MKMHTRRRPSRRTDEMLAGTELMAAGTPSPATIARLGSAPLFEGLDPASLEAAAARFEEAHFLPGHRVVVEGLRGSEFYLILDGHASVLVDGWRVAELGPGDFFGEIAILADGLRSASVRADSPLHCAVLSNNELKQLLLDHPRLGVNLLSALASRLQAGTGRRQPPASEFRDA